jgi:hypothetical protein
MEPNDQPRVLPHTSMANLERRAGAPHSPAGIMRRIDAPREHHMSPAREARDNGADAPYHEGRGGALHPRPPPPREGRANEPDALPRQGPLGALHPPPAYAPQAHLPRAPAQDTRHLSLLFPQTSNSEEARHLTDMHRLENERKGLPTDDLHYSMYHVAPRSGDSQGVQALGERRPRDLPSPGR